MGPAVTSGPEVVPRAANAVAAPEAAAFLLGARRRLSGPAPGLGRPLAGGRYALSQRHSGRWPWAPRSGQVQGASGRRR